MMGHTHRYHGHTQHERRRQEGGGRERESAREGRERGDSAAIGSPTQCTRAQKQQKRWRSRPPSRVHAHFMVRINRGTVCVLCSHKNRCTCHGGPKKLQRHARRHILQGTRRLPRWSAGHGCQKHLSNETEGGAGRGEGGEDGVGGPETRLAAVAHTRPQQAQLPAASGFVVSPVACGGFSLMSITAPGASHHNKTKTHAQMTPLLQHHATTTCTAVGTHNKGTKGQRHARLESLTTAVVSMPGRAVASLRNRGLTL